MYSAAGLDTSSRPILLSVLRSLHEARRPRIIIGLRMQDPIPDWITHLALISDGKVLTGTKEEFLEKQELREARENRTTSTASTTSAKRTEDEGKPVVILRNVNVSYGERKVKEPSQTISPDLSHLARQVLKSINWTIREGQRWHLQGANGTNPPPHISPSHPHHTAPLRIG